MSLNHYCRIIIIMIIVYCLRIYCIIAGKRWFISLDDSIDKEPSYYTKSVISPTGNRTPVSRVTGGDTYHYTIEDN